jgi:hypothetical protein
LHVATAMTSGVPSCLSAVIDRFVSRIAAIPRRRDGSSFGGWRVAFDALV